MNLREVPAPMSLREAVEAVKIVIPHAPSLSRHTKGLPLIKDLLSRLVEDDPAQPFRLLSLMFHGDMAEVARACEVIGPSGVPEALLNGMAANPLPDLIEAAWMLGLTEERWNARAD